MSVALKMFSKFSIVVEKKVRYIKSKIEILN
jgi:hypothetical protein